MDLFNGYKTGSLFAFAPDSNLASLEEAIEFDLDAYELWKKAIRTEAKRYESREIVGGCIN